MKFLGMDIRFGAPSQTEQTLAKLEAKLGDRLMETVDLLANWVDPWDRLNSPDGQTWIPIGIGGSNEEGRSPTDYSYIADEVQLTQVRDYCRLLEFTNPFAKNLHENMVNYIVGDGTKPTVVAQKGEEIDENKLRAVQEVLDEWMYENDFVCVQQESVRRYDRDGEYFRRFFKGANGDIKVRFVEPNHVTRPQGDTDQNKLFGIETDPDDVETVLQYWIDEEPIAAEEIQHMKANVDRNVRRGVPTTWPIGPLLKKAVDLLDSIAVTAQIQTSIALIRRTTGGTSAGATSLRSSASDWAITDPTTSRKEYHQKIKKGRIIDAPASTEYDFPASGLDVAKYSAGVQAILRGCAARVCFPEFMFTSDASNSNYASTMVAEGPAVRMFQRLQKRHEEADQEVMWRVLEAKAEAGLIDAGLLERIEIQCEHPRVEVRDELAFAQTNELLSQARILSPQTWSARSGLDYEQEQQNLEQHDKEHPEQAQQDAAASLNARMNMMPNDANRQARMEALEAYFGGIAGGIAGGDGAELMESEGVWRTINGAHVLIKDGKITKGPKHLVGKTPDEAGSGSNAKSSGNHKPDSAISDHAASVIDQWATPAHGSRLGEYERIRSEGEQWVAGKNSRGFEDLYQETQDRLKAMGVTEIRSYRGVGIQKDHPLAQAILAGKINAGDEISASGMTITSWSDHAPAAEHFAQTRRTSDSAIGVVFERTIPRDDVVGSYKTHRGFLDGENEVIARNKGKLRLKIKSIIAPKSDRAFAVLGESKESDYDLSDTDRQRGIEKANNTARS